MVVILVRGVAVEADHQVEDLAADPDQVVVAVMAMAMEMETPHRVEQAPRPLTMEEGAAPVAVVEEVVVTLHRLLQMQSTRPPTTSGGCTTRYKTLKCQDGQVCQMWHSG